MAAGLPMFYNCDLMVICLVLKFGTLFSFDCRKLCYHALKGHKEFTASKTCTSLWNKIIFSWLVSKTVACIKFAHSNHNFDKFQRVYLVIMCSLITLFCQLDTLKYTVDRTAKDLDGARQKHNLLKKEVTNRTEKYGIAPFI